MTTETTETTGAAPVALALTAAEQQIAALRELVAAQDALLVAYRTGDARRGGPAADRVDAARRRVWRASRAPEQKGES